MWVFVVEVSEILAFLLIASNVFWAWVTNKLVNKLMSRNYFEFKQADVPPVVSQKTIKLTQDETEDYGGLAELTHS